MFADQEPPLRWRPARSSNVDIVAADHLGAVMRALRILMVEVNHLIHEGGRMVFAEENRKYRLGSLWDR